MQNEDQYLERTPDLVEKVRAMREAAQKEMNRFTRLSDYDIRRVVGRSPKPAPASAETGVTAAASERPKRSSSKSASGQAALEFAPAPAERGGTNGEDE